MTVPTHLSRGGRDFTRKHKRQISLSFLQNGGPNLGKDTNN